jgi:hypothetical protein
VIGPSLARLLLRVVTVHSLAATLPAVESLDPATAAQLRREWDDQTEQLELGRLWLEIDELEILDLAEAGLRAGWLTPAALTSLVDQRRESDLDRTELRVWLEAARDAALPEL